MAYFPCRVFGILLLLNLVIAVLFGWSNPVISYQGHEPELWSLLTTHFSHSSLQHLLANMMALMLLLILFKVHIIGLLKAFIVTVFAVAIYASLNQIESFQGASALLYCIPGCFVSRIHKDDPLEASVVVIIFLCYLIINEYSYLSASSAISFTAAHLIGFVSGLLSEWYHSQLLFKSIKNIK